MAVCTNISPDRKEIGAKIIALEEHALELYSEDVVYLTPLLRRSPGAGKPSGSIIIR